MHVGKVGKYTNHMLSRVSYVDGMVNYGGVEDQHFCLRLC